MKQLMMGFAACALLLTGCTEQDITERVIDGQGQLIFSTGVGKQATKTAELTNTALREAATEKAKGIALRTYQDADPIDGTYKKWFVDDLWHSNGEWKIETTRFRNTVPTKFVTYFPKTDKLAEVNDVTETSKSSFETADFKNTFPSFTYTVGANSTAQEDLIAGITNVVANQTDITIGLRHILSQVNFGTKGYNGAEISIQNIQIHGLYNSATYTYGSADTYPVGEWDKLGEGGTVGDRDVLYSYFNHSNSAAGKNPQPVVDADAIKGDIYVFGDGGNAGPGRNEYTWYPTKASPHTWTKAHTTDPTLLDNSLMLMPQNFMTDAPDAKVTFEYKIQDADKAYVAGSDTEWESGEFKLNFATGSTPGTHYMGKWDQNYRYLYLIDFTDFLDGIALTFTVDVEMYPWENYNNGSGDDGIINIMAAGQPSAKNMNLIENTDIWYIGSQSKTSPNDASFDPKKWAQVMRNEIWDLSTYNFTKIEKDGTFNLNFENVIFNTSPKPSEGSLTTITLTLPTGYTAAIANNGTDIKIEGSNPYIISEGKQNATAFIIITNPNEEYSTPASLSTAIANATNSTSRLYKGSDAINLKVMEPTNLRTEGNAITVNFNRVKPTIGATANGIWTWNATDKIATWTWVPWINLTDAKTAVANASDKATVYCSDNSNIILLTEFDEPTVASVKVVFSTAANRTAGTTAKGAWSYDSASKTATWTKNVLP